MYVLYQKFRKQIIKKKKKSSASPIPMNSYFQYGGIYEGCLKSFQSCTRKNRGICGWIFSRQRLYMFFQKQRVCWRFTVYMSLYILLFSYCKHYYMSMNIKWILNGCLWPLNTKSLLKKTEVFHCFLLLKNSEQPCTYSLNTTISFEQGQKLRKKNIGPKYIFAFLYFKFLSRKMIAN